MAAALKGTSMNKCLTYLVSLMACGSIFANECPTLEGFELAQDHMEWQTTAKVSLVNLWAVWCPPCLKELPMLDSIANRNNYTIETIHIGDNPTAIDNHFNKLGIKYLPKTIEADFASLQQWGFHGLPATLITIDQQVIYRYSGYIPYSPEKLDLWLTCLAKENR